MLHLIFQSTFDGSLLHRMDSGDDLVFLESSVFRLIKGSGLTDELQKMIKLNINLYVLKCDLEIRGIDASELVLGFDIIDYSGLVQLTEKNKVIRTWS
ncbi:MAG: sulfurtransferase complex subunit TusB [Methylococcales bacterium]|nr:sulfurtransferase complex subunit TusB [Methylococcales bacterium]